MGNLEKRSIAIQRDFGSNGNMPITQWNRSVGLRFLGQLANTVPNERRVKKDLLSNFLETSSGRKQYKLHNNRLPKSILRVFHKEIQREGEIFVTCNEIVHRVTEIAFFQGFDNFTKALSLKKGAVKRGKVKAQPLSVYNQSCGPM